MTETNNVPIFAIECHDAWRFVQASTMAEALQIFEAKWGKKTIWQYEPSKVHKLLMVDSHNEYQISERTLKVVLNDSPYNKPEHNLPGELARYRRRCIRNERRKR